MNMTFWDMCDRKIISGQRNALRSNFCFIRIVNGPFRFDFVIVFWSNLLWWQSQSKTGKICISIKIAEVWFLNLRTSRKSYLRFLIFFDFSRRFHSPPLQTVLPFVHYAPFIRYEKSLQNQKNQESQSFFVRFSGFKNQIPQSQL